MCSTSSEGMPLGTPRPCINWVSGIITAWYGMNMPNRISVKTTLAYGKRQRDSTKPFIEPRNAEMIDAGMTMAKVRPSAGARVSQALAQPAVSHVVGKSQAVEGSASDGPLKLVMNRT